jgi:hypothetical protein
MAKKTENRGGARSGAGRPRKKKIYSEKVKSNYLRAARELAKEYGESIEKAVLRLAYLKETQDAVKIAVLKCYNEALLIRTSEKDVNVNKFSGPDIRSPIRLPPTKPDPAKVIEMEEKQAEKSAGGV